MSVRQPVLSHIPALQRACCESPGIVVDTCQRLKASVPQSAGQQCCQSPMALACLLPTNCSLISHQELPTLLSRHYADMMVEGKPSQRRASLQSILMGEAKMCEPSVPNVTRTKLAIVPLVRSKVELHDDINITVTPRIELDHEVIVRRVDETHSDAHKDSAIAEVELINAAMIADFDNKGIVHSSQATARLLLLNSFYRSLSCCEGAAGSRGASISEPVQIGMAAIERLFFSSLPKDLVEIVNVKYVAQADATNNFLRLLVSEGSFNIDAMFCSQGKPLSESTFLAGRAHQLASANQNDEDSNCRMFVVLFNKDLHCTFSEDRALPTCLITYRLSDHSKSLEHSARWKRFTEALVLATC